MASCASSVPSFSRSGRDQIPPARITAPARTVPRSVTTPATRPPSRSRPRAAQPSSIRAPRSRARRATAGTARPGSAKASEGVCTRPGEAAVVAARERIGLGGREHPCVELVGPRAHEPGGVASQILLGLGEVGRAFGAVADPAGLHGEPAPEVGRLDHQRQLLGRPALLADPAPVAGGLLARDPPLLEDGDGHPPLGEEERCADADDAPADHDDVDGGGHRIHGARLEGVSSPCKYHERGAASGKIMPSRCGLEAFQVLVELGSVTRAAHALGVS